MSDERAREIAAKSVEQVIAEAMYDLPRTYAQIHRAQMKRGFVKLDKLPTFRAQQDLVRRILEEGNNAQG